MSMMEKDNKRYHLIFKGNVQGVGFRFTAQNIAKNNDLTGWVKNNPDRTVEIIAQGPKDNLEAFFSQIKNYFSHNIRDYSKQEAEACNEFKEFSIRY